MTSKIRVRRGTAAQWTAANPLLSAGELGAETDTAKLKVGNGSATWNSLAYAAGAGSDVTLVAGTLTVDGESVEILTTADITAAMNIDGGTPTSTFDGTTIDGGTP